MHSIVRHITIIATIAVGLPVGACAWDEGVPFATLSPRIDARFDIPNGRDLSMGWQKLASDYQLKIESMTLHTDELSLINNGQTGLSFDPSNPPPGYTLCHNGHCHSVDGSLVPYEEISNELAQGGSSSVAAAMDTGVLDLVIGVSENLVCEPSCDLPLSKISVANLGLLRITASGLVRDGRGPGRIEGEIGWTLDLELADGAAQTLSSSLDLPADRSHPPDVSLAIRLIVTSRIFDRIQWAEFTVVPIDGGAGYDLDSSQNAQASIIQAMGELELSIRVER